MEEEIKDVILELLRRNQELIVGYYNHLYDFGQILKNDKKFKKDKSMQKFVNQIEEKREKIKNQINENAKILSEEVNLF